MGMQHREYIGRHTTHHEKIAVSHPVKLEASSSVGFGEPSCDFVMLDEKNYSSPPSLMLERYCTQACGCSTCMHIDSHLLIIKTYLLCDFLAESLLELLLAKTGSM
jgi:hypothetical protein